MGLEVEGGENVPLRGGLIVASNHQSYWDPPFLAAALGRELCFMAKVELFKVPLFGYMIKKLNAFPINRGFPDRKGIREALKKISEGYALLVFPEGTRKKRNFEGESGFAYLAIKGKVPILPVAVKEKKKIKSIKHCLPFLSKIKMKIGKPIEFHLNYSLEKRENLTKLTDAVMQEIKNLYESME